MIYQIFKIFLRWFVLYIKDFSLESINYYRIQIAHKSFDNKEKLCAWPYRDLGEVIL